MVLEAASLAIATLVSEDLACVSAGLLVQRGDISLLTAVSGCGVGIFAGDCGLWAVGRCADRLARYWPRATRLRASVIVRNVRQQVVDNAGWSILGSRFLPGARVPLYVAAGAFGLPGPRFARWALLATLLWTPSVILATANLGDLAERTRAARGWGAAAVAAALLLGMRTGHVATTWSGRSRVAARLSRWRRWEFWPMWLFYAPIVPWIAWLSLRHGGLTTITASNPGIPDGGIVGESKADILAQLPADTALPATRIAPGPLNEQIERAKQQIHSDGLAFPLIVKPDVGERGTGVRLLRSLDDLAAYLVRERNAVIIQAYHPGPYEAGIFYYRFPTSPRGRVLSITDKRFPIVHGDGHSTLEALIQAHPRYRLQASVFLERHHASRLRVLERGEPFRLAMAGNHAQGTMFLDGERLRTPALEARIDEIARSIPGFFVGRFDIRYQDVEAFKAGRDLAIVELNGASAESTNIYDPSWSLPSAYRQLALQWSIVFAIGAANRTLGAKTSSLRRLILILVRHASRRPAHAIAD